MGRIVALDLGDRWTGIAMSDPLQLTARPHITVETKDLNTFLTQFIVQETVDTVVVGYPKTLRGTESDQTKKVVDAFNILSQQFPTVSWQLWDERLSSKQAAQFGQQKTREAKLKAHAIAAAVVLSSYLDHLAMKKQLAQF